jgi:hypothetical protein
MESAPRAFHTQTAHASAAAQAASLQMACISAMADAEDLFKSSLRNAICECVTHQAGALSLALERIRRAAKVEAPRKDIEDDDFMLTLFYLQVAAAMLEFHSFQRRLSLVQPQSAAQRLLTALSAVGQVYNTLQPQTLARLPVRNRAHNRSSICHFLQSLCFEEKH